MNNVAGMLKISKCSWMCLLILGENLYFCYFIFDVDI